MRRIILCITVGMCVLALGAIITANADGNNGMDVRVLGSLKSVPIPPTDFSSVLNSNAEARTAATALGKALFWDSQAGSDGKQACASCHFDTGADSRYKGQMNLGAASSWKAPGGVSPASYIPSLKDYPFHKLADPKDRDSKVLSSSQHVVGSQGVHQQTFIDVVPGSPVEVGSVATKPASNHAKATVITRRTTNRNTPTIVNAVYNYRNFWDGRADNVFNGVSPFGSQENESFLLASDANGQLLVSGAEPAHKLLSLKNASLASQAVGPPGNPVEMAYIGRDFRKLGKKMLSLRPLADQFVAADDSTLGRYSNQRKTPGTKGLNTSYEALIKEAFKPEWWNSTELVDANGKFVMTTVNGKQVIKTGAPSNTDEYTLTEYNFSMYWGIAIQMYEATLVADNSRFDQFMDGNQDALDGTEKTGLIIFLGKGNCTECHMGPEMTDAAVANLPMAKSGQPGNPAPGFHNIGVRPISEIQATGSGAPGAVTMAVKTPGLRNIELTAPFFHNGGQLTLEQVVQFYNRGGDFGSRGVDLDIEMHPLGLTPSDEAALVAFLRSLTDPRALNQSAPFDHPSIDIPNGAVGGKHTSIKGVAIDDPDTLLHVSAAGTTGTTSPLTPFAQHLH